jgi:hypothetical protein
MVSAIALMASPVMAQDTPDNGAFNDLTQSSMNNFFEIARTFGGDLCDKVTNAMMTAIPPRRTLTFLVGVILFSFFVNFVIAIYNAMAKGTAHGLIGDFAVFFSQSAPRLITHVVAAMLVAGAAGILLVPSGKQPDWWFFKLTRTTGGKQFAMLIDKYNPATKMEESASNISQNINGIDYMFMQQEVASQLDTLSASVHDPGPYGDGVSDMAQSGAGLTNAIAKMWNDTIEQFLSLTSQLCFFWGQFMLVKGFIINMVYFKLAWRLAILMMPYLILLAYFRGFSSFLQNILKHLFAMSIAGLTMAMVANEIFQPTFWKSTFQVAFAGVSLDTKQTLAFRYLPELMKTYGKWVLNAQIGFLLGFIGVILDRMYEAVRAGTNSGVSGWQTKNLNAGADILRSSRYSGVQGHGTH